MQKNQSAFTDQELREEVKKIKPSPITNAFFIGVLIGILVYSILVNNLGFLSLIPLFFIYKLIQKSKRQKHSRN